MSKYSRQQEERIKQYFNARPRWEVVHYYGSRNKNAGDFLVKYTRINTLVRIDHKSTTSDCKFSLQKEWLPKLGAICLTRQDKEGISKPLITFSFKNDRTLWTLGYLSFHIFYGEEFKIKEGKKSLGITRARVLESVHKPVQIDFNGYLAYIMPLDNWLKEYE